MKTLGSLITLLGAVFIIIIAANYNAYIIEAFFNWPTLVGIGFPVVGVTVATRSFKTMITGINGALSQKYRMTEEERDKSVTFFKLIRTTVLYAGVLTFFAALVTMLLSLDDPAALGPKSSIALLGIVWSVFLNMLLVNPIIYSLQQKRTEESQSLVYQSDRERFPAASPRITEKEAAAKLLKLCMEKGITYEEIMNADDISLRVKQ